MCKYVDTECSAINACRTCTATGGCAPVRVYPNATVAEYGTYSYFTDGFGAAAHKIKAEIYGTLRTEDTRQQCQSLLLLCLNFDLSLVHYSLTQLAVPSRRA